MNLDLKRRLAVGLVVAAVSSGSAGTALACHGGGGTAQTSLMSVSFHHQEHAFAPWWTGTITGYLGLSADTIKADLHSGQTLAAIANATPGKSAAGLVDAIVTPWKAKLDAKVAANELSASDEATILSHLNAKVTAFVNGDWHWWWWKHRDDHRR